MIPSHCNRKHDGYHRLSCFLFQHYDVALITMQDPLPATGYDHIGPVCLPTGKANYAGEMATVAGWGSLKVLGRYTTWLDEFLQSVPFSLPQEKGPQPAVLQELTMKVWDNAKCSKTYGNYAPAGITDHMLCAGKQGKDSCSVSLGDISCSKLV